MLTTSSGTSTALANGCCGQDMPISRVPLLIANPPGLSAIRYRIGTFTSFRQAMLDSIAIPDLMATSVTTLTGDISATATTITVLDPSQFPSGPNFRIKIGNEYLQVIDGAGHSTWKVVRGSGATAHANGDHVVLSPPNPFASWRPNKGNDYQTVFVELWAYLADVLTFYQERIANEAYLGTASLRDSLLRLVSLIDYHPKPGAGASGLVAFTASQGSSLIVPASFRVGSKPSPGQPGVIFETSSALAVSGANSAIRLSVLSPDVPFPPKTVVLQGISNGLSAGDYIIAVENQGTNAETVHLLRLSSVTTDRNSNTTAITWQQELGDGAYDQATKQVAAYAFRVKAIPFGANAPQFETLSPTLTNSDRLHPKAPFPKSWDAERVPPITLDFAERIAMIRSARPGARVVDSSGFRGSSVPPETGSVENEWFYVPTPNDPPNYLFLSTVYQQLNYTEQNPGWAVLLTDDTFQTLHVIETTEVVKVGYTLTSQSTRLRSTEDVQTFVFPLRKTTVLTGSELLKLQIDLPLADPVSGNELILQGVQSELQSGQTVVISGNLFDPATGQASSTSATESGILDGPPVADPVKNVTKINLKTPLARQYARATTVLMANIVEVTQGETVKDEVLGSGNGSAPQSYPLKKKPLTYLPSSDPEGLAAVKSTLKVIVNGVAWNEKPNLADSTPDAQDFTTTLDDSGQTTVVFGDGFNGARPPSGFNNIHARYRKGLGSSGNLSSGAIQQLIDSVPNLQKVTNPLPSSGGSDPDPPAQIRVAAGASLRTFSRAVSTADYAALALNFPGISKATASWIVSDPVTLQAVAHPYVQLTVATVDRLPIQGTLLAAKLRSFLNNHRDPNVLLRLQDFTPIYIEVTVQLEIESRFPHNATLNRVQAALNPGVNPDGSAGYFAFDNLQFGQTIFLSPVYAAIQNLSGVKDATIMSLRKVGPGAADPPGAHDIVVGPTEIATIGPPGAGQGQLTVAGQGGFADA